MIDDIMKHIILDTNFLLIPAQFKVDIFSEIQKIMEVPYELCIVDRTLEELDKLKDSASGRDKQAARLALQLLKAKEVRSLKTEKNLNTDKLIVELAKPADFIVATQDMALKDVLKRKSVQLIVLRQKKYLKLI
ncbi:nucleotide-binding protein [Candidatus Woesearchaeota archaeon]|nr:nucleotide-binding protein [Candidatus Woesearchaeota archaeon]